MHGSLASRPSLVRAAGSRRSTTRLPFHRSAWRDCGAFSRPSADQVESLRAPSHGVAIVEGPSSRSPPEPRRRPTPRSTLADPARVGRSLVSADQPPPSEDDRPSEVSRRRSFAVSLGSERVRTRTIAGS